MAASKDDLDFGHLFRVIFMQGGQVAIGTAIGAGVLLLVGIIAVFLAPIWLPIFAFVYWRREKRKRNAAGQDVTDLVPVSVDAAGAPVEASGHVDAPAFTEVRNTTPGARRGGEAPSSQV